MTDFATRHFTAPDGVDLAWHEMGEGRPVILIHGLFSDAFTNWIRYGHAARIAERGFRVIMPDLRAHGQSGKPHDPALYPRDVLADDGFALIDHLGIESFDLGGYSLGGRTSVRMVAKGARPGKLVIAGMGLQGLLGTSHRADHFRNILTNLGTFTKGSPEWMAETFLKTTKGDPKALLNILDTFVDTDEAALGAISCPALVVSGDEDQDNGSAQALADLLPDALYVETPGRHMSAVTKPELGAAIADFLAA